MTVMQIFGVAPATMLGQAQLAENLTIVRDAWRDAGKNVNLVSLVSGGVPGSMAISQEFADWEAWAAAQAAGMPASVQEAVSKLPPSGGVGQQIVTMAELPGLETDSSSLPRGLMGVSRIKVQPGKATIAMDMVAKSKEILTGLGASVRIFNAVQAMEMGIISFNNYFESSAAMIDFFNKMQTDAEWQAHWNNPARIGNTEVVSQSIWTFVD